MAPPIVYYAMLLQGYLPNETDLKAGGTRQTALHAAAAEATRAVFGRNVYYHRAQSARDAIAPAAAATAIRV